VLNGVFGFWVNDEASMNKTLAAIDLYMISSPRFRRAPDSRTRSAACRQHVRHVVAHSHGMGRRTA
jgi:hypothetical protein